MLSAIYEESPIAVAPDDDVENAENGEDAEEEGAAAVTEKGRLEWWKGEKVAHGS